MTVIRKINNTEFCYSIDIERSITKDEIYQYAVEILGVPYPKNPDGSWISGLQGLRFKSEAIRDWVLLRINNHQPEE